MVNSQNYDIKNDFIHKNDIGELIFLILRKKIKSGVYNVGSGSTVSVKKICKIIYKIFGKKLNLPSKKSRNIDFKANINKINKATGWKPKIKLNEKILTDIINA